MFDNDLDTFGTGKTLNIDGDIVVFKHCCIFNDDSDHDRTMIGRTITKYINKMVIDAGCDDYQIFLTTKTNFRDKLVPDYKANRSDAERPVNLAWAKRWAVDNLNSNYCDQLEADDLLGIYMTDSTVLWSIDKDLRQIPGKHLDEATRKVVTITEQGILKDLGKKAYFDGWAGFYYQMLVGDSTDYILGCALRVPAPKTKSGVKRVGVGHKAACAIINKAVFHNPDNAVDAMKQAVAQEYYKVHKGKDWVSKMETQANLLWMVREKTGELIRRWTYDDRMEYFNLRTGLVVRDETY